PTPMTGSFSLVEGTALVMSGRLLSSAASAVRLTANPTVASTPDCNTRRREMFDRSDVDIAKTPFWRAGRKGGATKPRRRGIVQSARPAGGRHVMSRPPLAQG